MEQKRRREIEDVAARIEFKTEKFESERKPREPTSREKKRVRKEKEHKSEMRETYRLCFLVCAVMFVLKEIDSSMM